MDRSRKTKNQLIEELELLETRLEGVERGAVGNKATEMVLQGADARYHDIFDYSHDAIFLIDPTQDEILDVNSRACDMLSFSREELLAMKMSAIHPNEMTQMKDFGESVFEQGHGWTDELTCLTRLGALLPAEISASVMNVNGRRCILALVRDISKRRHAEQTVERLASFPEQNPNPVIETDLTGQVTYCNPAAKTVFPDLEKRGHQHPILSGVEPLIIACQTGESASFTTRELQIGNAVYEQKICCVERSDLVRIFTYDLTDRLWAEELEHENVYLREEMQTELAFGEIVGQSPALHNVLQQIEMVAPTNATVLIQGESGTGKELIARAIHSHSQRSAKTMVKVNCGAIPHDLFESEFFGHVKGAFTGAIKDRKGRFELADGGTIFLDEVSEIPLDLQSKLLRVTQEGQFERVGDDRTREVDVRVIAATNRDLKEEIDAGRFREDLFYRLSVFPSTVPPLRERVDDIPLLAQHFIEVACTQLNRPKAELTPDQIKRLQDYEWPGNIRELQNVIERAVIVSRGGVLRLDLALPADTVSTGDVGPAADRALTAEAGFVTEAEFKRREQENIVAALERANWKVFGQGGAAELLEIKPTTLVTRIKKMGLKKRG